MSRRHRLRRTVPAAALITACTLVAACRPHTVDLGFHPEVGDTFRFRSTVRTEVDRTIDGEAEEPSAETATLDATEVVTDISEDTVTIDVSVTRDGAGTRDYTARFERGEHLTAASLIEGATTDAVGLELSTHLPEDLASPPDGPLEPGARWTISRRVEAGAGTIVITGAGRVVSLRVVEGREVAVVDVELRVPIWSSLDTPNGVVHLDGVQTSESRTVYDLVEGTVVNDQTTLEGRVDLTFDPPEGIQAEPVPGSIDYSVVTDTQRVFDD